MRVYDVVAHRSKEVKKADIGGYIIEWYKPKQVRLLVKVNGEYKDNVVVSRKKFESLRLNTSKMMFVDFTVRKLTEAEIEAL